MRLDQKYHSYHFPAKRLAFSAETEKLTPCVLIKHLVVVIFPAERLSFSDEAKTIIEDMPAMIEDSEEEMTEILCVSI